jgi:APA family basic amino acid/polyamine antiporter
VAAHALGLTPLVFLFAGGLFALTAKTYAEGASMFPEAGGSSSFARHAFNDWISFFAGWALSLDYILTIAISAYFVPFYASALPGLHALHNPPGNIIFALGVLVLLVFLNIRGLGESARVNFVLAVTDLGTQVLVVILGAALVLNPSLLVNQVHLWSAPSLSQLIFALSIAMLAYTGIETVSNMAEEAQDPGNDVPRAVNFVLIAVLTVYMGISVIALSALPVTDVHGVYSTLLGNNGPHGFESEPVLGIVDHLGLGGALLTGAQYYVGLLATTILFIATNAGIIGISRLSWSLSEHRQLPGIFSRLHQTYRTPWFTIVFFSGFAVLLIAFANINVLGNLYSFGAMLSFTTAHAAIVVLRIKDPDRERPYRMPGNVMIRGRQIPITAVIGGTGTFLAWVAVVALHPEAKYVGIPWMVVGMVGYVIYRKRSGLSLSKSVVVVRPERPPDFHELGYRTALVPIFGGDVSAQTLVSAAKLIGKAGIVYAVFVLPVPRQLSLDAGLVAEEALGRSILESARIQGRRAGIKVQTGLIRTRNPGAALADEARRIGADVIYLSTLHAPVSEQRIGLTASYLLDHRPCRIVIETDSSQAARPLAAV